MIEALKITSVEYEQDVGSTIIVELNGNTETFIIQLTGGDYSPQMGCWICHDKIDGDVDFSRYFIEFEPYVHLMIAASEQSHENYCLERLNEDGDEWTTGLDTKYFRVNSGASVELISQKNSNGNHRVFIEKSGHINTTEYAQFPEFFIQEFDNEDDAKKFIDEYSLAGE